MATQKKTPRLIAQLAWLAGLALAAIAASHGSVVAYLEFNRSKILSGEWWRLLTSHLTHFDEWHLAANLAYLSILIYWSRHLALEGWLSYCAFATVVVPVALLLEPDPLEYYRGISALLYGLTVWGSLALAARGRRYLYLIPVGILIFIAIELLGLTPVRYLAADAVVYPAAHLYAVLAAIFWHFLWRKVTHKIRRVST